MKSVATVLVAAVVFVTPMAVQDANGQVEFTLGGGLNSPMGDYGDQANVGYAITTGIGYRLARFLSVGVEIGFYGNSASDAVLAGLAPGTEMTSRIEQYAGTAKWFIPAGNHNLFLKGVFGSYRGTAKVTSPLGEFNLSNTDPGYGLGGGLLINGKKTPRSSLM
jgi:hypothetical protein